MLSLRVLRAKLKDFTRLIWTVETRDDDLVLKDEKKEHRFPYLWLRDNCQCGSCFHEASHSRIIDIEHFDFNAQPLEATLANDKVNVRWHDSHSSSYQLSWLLERQFNPDQATDNYQPHPRPWSAEDFSKILRRFQYHQLLDSDSVLLDWLESLAVDGVALVEGAQTRPGQIQPLADKVAFLKKTYYGETFTVQAKPGTSNVAYLSGSLQLHTDLPYYHYKPGVNMLHCIVQAAGFGGQSILADGLEACDWLRETHPQHYWILTTVNVDWEDIVEEDGRRFHTIYRAPVICENNRGEVERINWSQPQRSSHFHVPVAQVSPWYRAVQQFTHYIHSHNCKVQLRINPGDILTFNNLRVLHGRSDYKGERHLEGAYLDWDLVYSRIRVLKEQSGLS
ncbi:gamma-butyrobetaine dioxygenase-like [Macrosteles quadrilineatus]|uniref:gamma-butyrobetaine dioxygenase-like n=1 Tax=Macrosteles quadrilineatus TaxID=74068 RepID=UPI0023E1D584|nr:gamma-butyrobetaine dioxygenase-like [Macrosteles quadrilineatus]